MIDETKVTRNEIVKKYRWTKRLIDKYLHNPEEKRNYRSKARPIKLYSVTDVEKAMQTAEFKHDFEKIENLRAKRGTRCVN